MSEMTISKKVLRHETNMATTVGPATFEASLDTVEAISDAIAETERAEPNKESRFYPMVSLIKKLAQMLRKANVEHAFTRRDMVVWLALEVMDTDVGPDELIEWLTHEATLQELVFGEDKTSMYKLIRRKGQKRAWERYRHLLRHTMG